MKRCLLACFLLSFSVVPVIAQTSCVSFDYLQQQLQSEPGLSKKLLAIEGFINKPASATIVNGSSFGGSSQLPVIKIPVVVHILYNNPTENISDAQVRSQIEALNKDYRRTNMDTAKTPASFKGMAADCGFEFSLAVIDPRDRATTGIVRRQTSIQYFGIDDRIKSSAIGGDDAWDPDRYLNIWVGNLAGGMIGYASVPGGPKEKDGVAIKYTAFGTIGTASLPYNLGRTATHEIGHWLGLHHIWGDQYCGDDLVGDTPPQQTSSYGCPSGTIISCSNAPYGNMYMNYMDLTYDACTNLFTDGQRDRMRSLFNEGGPRFALLSSNGSTGTPLPEPVETPAEGRNTIQVYPNPASNTVMVAMNHADQLTGKMISVFNNLGQLLMQQRITKGTTQLNVASLKEGMYFIKVGDRGNLFKVIKTGSTLNP